MSKRDNDFQHLVLAGLWVLISLGFGIRNHRAAVNFQSSAIAFGDLNGTEGEKAKEYRREVTYGGILP